MPRNHGPASQSPSRLQRLVAAGHPLFEALFVGSVSSWTVGVYVLFSSGDAVVAAAFAAVSLVGSTFAYYLLVARRSGSREERAQRVVVYPRGLTARFRRQRRR